MVKEQPQRRETDDGFPTMYHPGYRQTYHSTYGALTEARHVFLEQGGVLQRLREQQCISILEIGFGLGLNFWLSCSESLKSGSALEFTSIEMQLLTAEQFSNLDYPGLLGLEDLGRQWLNWRRSMPSPVSPDIYEFKPYKDLFLRLILGDACNIEITGSYDAIFLDAFSPDENPELWTESFIKHLAEGLACGGVISTYSAKGSVRRAMLAAGLDVEKCQGPPGKREMLRAIKSV
jgi:tRNA U34 5-methylaminomethyl-2-thiouridine-forming methyltransferase MnmC